MPSNIDDVINTPNNSSIASLVLNIISATTQEINKSKAPTTLQDLCIVRIPLIHAVPEHSSNNIDAITRLLYPNPAGINSICDAQIPAPIQSKLLLLTILLARHSYPLVVHVQFLVVDILTI